MESANNDEFYHVSLFFFFSPVSFIDVLFRLCFDAGKAFLFPVITRRFLLIIYVAQ